MKFITFILVSLLMMVTAYATGGDWFETPTKLSDSLDMLPGKSMGQIFLETSPKPPAGETSDIGTAAKEVADRIGREPFPTLLKLADGWIAQARAQGDNSACNLAHDLRDAIAVSADNPGAAREYILWRVEHPLISATLADTSKRAETATGLIKANWLYASGAIQFLNGDRTDCQEWFDRVVKEYPKTPRAEMAMFMSARCAFSAARKLLSDSTGEAPQDNQEEIAARAKAVAKFEALRKRYPRGRFDADALGWLGALACDAKNYLKALDYYIAQAEAPGHPETLRTAIYSCEKALAHVATKPGGDAALNLIARHPRIAMAFTYLVLSAPEADNYDGKFDNPADVRKWRRTILPRIAAAVARQKEAYKSGDWQPRYLAMLVHAASASGNTAQALQLSELAPDQLTRSDDLLFARGVALQRANKTSEAIDAFQTFLHSFPKSLMAPGVRVRLALALQDNHQAGEAIVLLRDLLPKPKPETTPAAPAAPAKADKDGEDGDAELDTEKTSESDSTLAGRWTQEGVYPTGQAEWKMTESSVYPNLSGTDKEQIQQLIDTLLNFAPLPELAAAVGNPSFDTMAKNELRAILAERYLAAENFAEAKKFITASATREMADRLDRLTSDNTGTPPQKAERMVQIGDTWAQARGQLLRSPLDTKLHIYESPSQVGGLTRRDNGNALHLANTEDQLDDRDELHHASRWWMRAARLLPGSPIAAQARLKALEALPAVARASTYAETRAYEIKLDAVSREIYDKLRSECPKSPEAQRLAAYWSVPSSSKEEAFDSLEINYGWPNVCQDDAVSRGYPFSDDEAFLELVPASANRGSEPSEEITNRVKALRSAAASQEPAGLLKQVQTLAQDLRASMGGPEEAGGANCLEDLAQFLAEPGITRDAQQIYVNLRLDILHRARAALPDPGIEGKDDDDTVKAAIDAAEKNAAFKSLGDYLDFCRIALVAGARTDIDTGIKDPKDPENSITYISRDHAIMDKMARAFLQKYPRSHKREAAMFVVARSVYSLSCPYIECVGVLRPNTQPTDNLVDVTQKPHYREPFKPERVMQALDEYDRAFPNGRYAADVRNLRAATLWRLHQWDKALSLTLAQINDKTHAELQAEAAILLANIFAELAQAEHRPEVMAAIRAQPAAIPFLQAYTTAAMKSRDHPLRYLQKYLSDQFQFTIPGPTKEVAAE